MGKSEKKFWEQPDEFENNVYKITDLIELLDSLQAQIENDTFGTGEITESFVFSHENIPRRQFRLKSIKRINETGAGGHDFYTEIVLCGGNVKRLLKE